MNQKTPGPGRPKGCRSAKPSKAAIANYYRLLQNRADEGDVDAARHLIDLHERHQRQEAPAR